MCIRDRRRAYARLATAASGALDEGSLDLLAPGFPWAALWHLMAKEGQPVRWQGFLGAVAAVCKARRSEKIRAVAGLYGVDGQLSAESLMALLRDAEMASRGGEASESSASAIFGAVVADVQLAGPCNVET